MFLAYVDGVSCKAKGILPVKWPDIPAPKERIEEYEVSGRNGILTVSEDTYDPLEIPIEFNFLSKDWYGVYLAAKAWLSGCKELVMGDNAGCFYKIYYVTIDDVSRPSAKKGSFTANFVCDPFTYFQSGKQIVPFGDLYNQYYTAAPTYYIEGEGLCTITVNGNTFSVNVGQNATIDTDRQITYRQDNTIMNSDVTGDYEDLYLVPGQNTLSVTDGFTVTVQPNWRAK